MSGDKLPRRNCPSCGQSGMKRVDESGALRFTLHCKSKGSDCTWINCACGTTFDIYTGRCFSTMAPEKKDRP